AIACSTLNTIYAVKDKSLWQSSTIVQHLVNVGDYAFNTKVKMQQTKLKDYVPKQVAGG
ncbi:CvpA family protein, partial [Francisella tularensis subsp. holarctica]|nr:CvpA family protein [Francisella tularensis subsp. holarctica]